MPGRGWKHLQFAGIGFADAWSGSEASTICWNWICRCLVGVGSICNLLKLDLQIHIGVNSGRGSICNLLELDLQMPGRGWKHLQFAGYEFADTYPGVGSICNLLELDLQMPGRGWKHLQLVGIGFADAWPGLEASATCWNWICRCLVRVGSICNLLKLELQMPGQGWNHLQFVGYEFADAWLGL